MKRIVVKIGSNVLTRADQSLDVTRLSSLVDQIVEIRRSGCQVIIVSSGAVACGRSIVKAEHVLDPVQQRQLYSAVGQAKLIDSYCRFFNEYGVNVGQVLTMKSNFSSPEEASNQKQCMEVMLRENVVPIVNENDTVCVTELMFTDNDELSGLVAKMLSADELIILSNVDGVFEGESDNVVPKISPSDDTSRYIRKGRSSAGRGGMESKIHTAQSLAAAGVKVMIANGKREAVLTGLVAGRDVPHTEFSL